MQTVTSLDMLRTALAGLRADGARIALVPTMGALHEGHLTLVRRARAEADHVVASIFVNPRQFGPNEDLDAYPRQPAADAAMLEAEGVSLLWTPGPEAMYPAGFATTVSVAGVSEGLCGAARPGHFDGVATVVLKLFNQVAPDMAFFGEKDFQQLQIIRRMTQDLGFPIRIIGGETRRDADGLAQSSRNLYLSADERRTAGALFAALHRASVRLSLGAHPAEVLEEAHAHVMTAGFRSVDYITVVDPETLIAVPDSPLAKGTEARLLGAAWLGRTRLIDNISVSR